jgi:hypothetical protein
MAIATRSSAPVEVSRPQKIATGSANLVVLMIGIGTSFAVHFVGDLYLAEILMLLVFPFLVMLRGRRALRPELKGVYVFLGLWLLGLVIADAYNHTDPIDRLRGIALIVFFGIDIAGLSILIGRHEKRKLLFLVGLMIGALASVKLQPSDAVDAYPWKFGYAWGTIQLVLLISSYFYGRRRYIVSAFLILGICGVNLIMNFRSPVLNLLVTIALVYPIVPERLGGLQILPRSQILRLVILALLAGAAAGAASGLVNFVTRAGYIDEESQAKNEAQAKSGNLLLGGRPEFSVGLQAALDSPIIGHGSWAKDPKYYEMLYDALVESGSLDEQVGGDILSENGDPMIPGHSHIITSWIWAGIAGLIFWLYMIWFSLRGMARVAILRPSLAPLYMWFLISWFWDIFFSPFAAGRRIIEAALVVIVADLLVNKTVLVKTAWRRIGPKVHSSLHPTFNKPAASARLR